ncbi:MAG: YceI family protein [Acidobacteria bacterium]|nr:YceI family protein [Acidobacteriota bacterium]MCB9396345.1 YceI family protein [Acidobacteriota bacterium]
MKRIHGILLGLLISTVILAAEPPKAGTYSVDPAHSKVGFEVSHLVIATVEGHFSDYVGQITIGDSFEKSQFEATVQTGSVYTDQADRDKHLRSGDFFDAEKFPTMTFKSTGIKGSPENFEIMGDLTIKGTTKPVVFKAKYTGTVVDPWGNTKAAFRASTDVNRHDFGLSWSKMIEAGPVVGDTVTIELRIEAKLEK